MSFHESENDILPYNNKVLMECIVLGLLLHRKHAKATNSHVTITRLVVDVHISSAKRHAPLMQESMRRHPHKLDGMESLNCESNDSRQDSKVPACESGVSRA